MFVDWKELMYNVPFGGSFVTCKLIQFSQHPNVFHGLIQPAQHPPKEVLSAPVYVGANGRLNNALKVT